MRSKRKKQLKNNLWFPRSVLIVIHKYPRVVIPAWMPVDCMDAGGRAMQEQLPNPVPWTVTFESRRCLEAPGSSELSHPCQNDGVP